MSTKKEDKLRKLLKSVGPDKAAGDFTKEVMSTIEAAAGMEMAKNEALEALLRTSQIEKPAADFTSSVMTQVSRLENSPLDESILDEAILPKKVWYILTMAAIVVLLPIIFSEHSSQVPTGVMPYLVGMGNSFTTWFALVREIPGLYLLTLIACSALIGLDYMLRTTRLAGRLTSSQ